MSKRASWLLIPSLLLASTSSFAALTTYTDQTAFFSALGASPVTTEDFESSTVGDTIASGGSLGGITFSFDFGGSSLIVDDFFETTSGSNYLGVDDGSFAFTSGDTFTMTFSESVRAIGLHVIAEDPLFDNDFTLTTNNGLSVNYDDVGNFALNDGSTAGFLGLIESDFNNAFNSVIFSSVDANFLFNVDDISVSAVPVPAAGWLFGSALLAWVGLRRKQKTPA